jgi:nicotinate dehydrogenase subunit A
MTTDTSNRLEITVNGHAHPVRATAETPLLYVLRNELHLYAAKFGCGLAQCGSCRVLVDGVAQPSCNLPVSEAVGKQIVTLEGLSGANELHPLQQAFLDEQAGQCGYCIPGMIISAAGLLNHNPAPTDAEIRDALAINVCRCGSHPRILRAIQRVVGGAVE